MKSLLRQIVRFLKTDIGPTAVEYAVMIGLVILICFATIIVLGRQTNTSFENSKDEINKSLGH